MRRVIITMKDYQRYVNDAIFPRCKKDILIGFIRL